MVRARSVAGRIAAVPAAVALLASAVGFSAQPAAAGLVSGDSVPETTVLPANVDVMPGDPQDTGWVVLSVPVRLQAGQSRRISDQLTVTAPKKAVVQNMVECVDAATWTPVAAAGRPEAHSSGTNYSPTMGQFSMQGSLLFTAPFTGTFLCQIRAQVADIDPGYHMTAVAAPRPGGTWLVIDNFTDAAPLWWQINTCTSDGKDPTTRGTDPNCIFLGRPLGALGSDHPVTAILHGWPPTFLDTPLLHMSDLWIAPPNATKASVVGHMQITSCYLGTASCPASEQGSPPGFGGRAVFRTHLDFIQLDRHNAPCGVGGTPDTQYTITDNVHHLLVDYGPVTVPISATCGGSRLFALHIVVSWVAGNPVKIDAGSFIGFRSATNANVIVRSTGPTTIVPNLIGADQGSAAGPLAGSGLTMGTVTGVVNPARAGTVIAENSPAGTIEPTGSPVDLTVSLGAVAVPDLESLTAGQAISTLHAVGLAAHIEYRAQCVDPGQVIDQRPSAGTSVAPGSTVTITIDSSDPRLHPC
jgi:hypothetical protein